MTQTKQIERASETPEVSHLDSDTQRSVRQVFRNGYYETHQGLGVGGWPVVYKFASDWKTYVINISKDGDDEEFNDTIIAKDDDTARKAFADKYYLSDCSFYICEKTVTFREI